MRVADSRINPLEKAARYGVASCRGIGPVTFDRIEQALAAASESFLELLKLSEKEWEQRFGLTVRQVEALNAVPDVERLVGRLAHWDTLGWRLVFKDTQEYPRRLAETLDRRAPSFFFARGPLSLCEGPMAGVIGTRTPTRWGKAAAAAVARETVRRGWRVVSGYADGVDRTAHWSAVSAGGGTILVLPYGIQDWSGREWTTIAESEGRLCVLSQFPPGQGFSAGTAMARNLSVAALSNRVWVIESRRRGGAMETARMAFELKRPVMALMRAEGRRSPTGNRALIGEGAYPVDWDIDDKKPDSAQQFAPFFDGNLASRYHGQLELELSQHDDISGKDA